MISSQKVSMKPMDISPTIILMITSIYILRITKLETITNHLKFHSKTQNIVENVKEFIWN